VRFLFALLLATCIAVLTTAQDPEPHRPAKPPVTRIRVGPSVAASQLVHRLAPSFQQLEPGTKLKGTVRLQAIIAEDGSIEQLQVISGNPVVVGCVMDAVRQWKYRPTLLNGEPVQVDTEIDVDYKIDLKKSSKS
jgi:periplasmic protein TonB